MWLNESEESDKDEEELIRDESEVPEFWRNDDWISSRRHSMKSNLSGFKGNGFMTDQSVPFPCLCGAVFSPTGMAIYYSRQEF
jgi:hypothetical protein